jgi:hypothetical protein
MVGGSTAASIDRLGVRRLRRGPAVMFGWKGRGGEKMNSRQSKGGSALASAMLAGPFPPIMYQATCQARPDFCSRMISHGILPGSDPPWEPALPE